MLLKKYSLLIPMALLSLASITHAEETAKKEGDLETSLVQSPFRACKDVSLVNREIYDKDQAKWDQKCRDNSSIQILPKTGFFTTEIKDAADSLDFLQTVAEKVKATIDKNVEEKKEVLKCFQTQLYPDLANSEACIKTRKKEIDTAYENLPYVRQELALAEGTLKPKGDGFNPESEWINPSLKKGFFGLKGVYRADDIAPLNESETEQTKAIIKKEMEPFLKQPQKDAEAAFAQIQMQHKEHYLSLLQDAPALVAIGSLPERSSASEQDLNKRFAKAYTTLIEEAKDAQENIHELIEKGAVAIKSDSDKESAAKKLLDFMAYEPVVEEVLSAKIKSNPKICALATSLLSSKEYSDTRGQLAEAGALTVGGGLAAVGARSAGAKIATKSPAFAKFMARLGLQSDALTAVALGPAFGAYYRGKTHQELEQKRGGVATGVTSAQALDEAEGAEITGYLFAGLDWAGTGAFTGIARLVTNDAAAKNLLKTAASLKAHGLNEREIDKFMELANSPDPKVRAEARTKLAEAMKKIPKDELKKALEKNTNDFFDGEELTATEKDGIKKLADAGYTNELKKSLQNLAARDRRRFLDDTIEAFKKVNQDLYDNTGKPTAERAINAAIQFGHKKDPERIAKILNEWKPKGDSSESLKGIDGLTTVLRKASGKMSQPNYSGIADVEARQKKAFDDTLRELLEKDKKFTDMPKEKQEAQIKEMNSCYFGK